MPIWENAKVALQDAEAALEIVKSGPSALQSPLTALGPEMARLEQTRQKMENTRLTRPGRWCGDDVEFSGGRVCQPRCASDRKQPDHSGGGSQPG